jgi:hypothetical protein
MLEMPRVVAQEIQDLSLAPGQSHSRDVFHWFSHYMPSHGKRIENERNLPGISQRSLTMQNVAYLLPKHRHTTWNPWRWPPSPAMEPIYPRHQELHILGIAAWVIRQG